MTELTGMQAKTIHSFISKQENTKEYNKMLDNKLFIIDETSMVDILLFNNFLAFVGNRSQIALVGDVNQLPSIREGLLLRDMIESNCIPVIYLQTSQRFTGAISLNSNLINQGYLSNNFIFDDSFVISEMSQKNTQADLINAYLAFATFH